MGFQRSHKPTDEESRGSAQLAYERILELVEHSEYCRSKMKTRLLRDGFSAPAADAAIEKAVSYAIIDDIRFGEIYAASKIRRGFGRNGIRRELEQFGIDSSQIEQLDQTDSPCIEVGESEADRAYSYLMNHPPHSKHPRNSAYQKLVRKGFSATYASEAVRRWAADMNIGYE